MSNFEASLSELGEGDREELDVFTQDLSNQLKYLGRANQFIEIWKERNYRNLDEIDRYLIQQSKLKGRTFSYVMDRISDCYRKSHRIFKKEELNKSLVQYIRDIDERNLRTYLQYHLEDILTEDLDWVSNTISEHQYYKRYECGLEAIKSEIVARNGLDILDNIPDKCDSISDRYRAAVKEGNDFRTSGGTPELESAVYDAIWLAGCGIAITYDGAEINPLSVGMSLMGLAAYGQARN
ncbi:hypothetical protein [Halorussus pelagicus]|uniref:hypothetical protein n=1 Tax=Halorussus pelagicus TaxID=2505977 RepID=UPI000FFBDA7E|nr:hypothetical protein [Halorussus pelagicus]